MATISEAVYFCAHFAQSSVKGGQEYDEQNGKQGVRTGDRSGHPHGPKRGPSAGAAEALGVSGEDDIQALVDEARYGKGR